MADLKFDIDVKEIAKTFGDLKENLQKDLTGAVGNLAAMTHSRTLELARDELGSLSQKYMDNVEFANPAPNLWVVTLKEPAMWIEEGRKNGWMQELLDGKSAKQGKNGKYAVIPFEHNTPPSQQSEKARTLANQIREGLEKEGIKWKKIERDASGSPRLGRLHTINVATDKIKPEHKNAPGMGVSVYQTKDKSGNVRRDVLTFRVISEKHKGEGLWIHPGREGDKLMDKAFDWSLQLWEKEILPATLDKYK